MTDKNQIIVGAAGRMFARYGYAKTTMGDIAAEANVARQTVYNAFPGKEEILRAVVRKAGEDSLTAVKAAWAISDQIDAKLAAFHELAPLKWYEAIHAAPDWAELMDGMHKAASEELKALDVKWRAALKEMLQEHVLASADATPELDEIVDFFYSTSLNAKHGVENIAQLQSRLATIKVAALGLLKS